MDATLSNEKVTYETFFTNINKRVEKSVTNEGFNRTRILFAGPNPNGNKTMVIYRIVELLNGRYFMEETVYNPYKKSVHSTITSLLNEKFHKVVPAKEKLHQRTFHPNPEIIAATSYTRSSDLGLFHNYILRDWRTGINWKTPITNFYLRWKLSAYLNKTLFTI